VLRLFILAMRNLALSQTLQYELKPMALFDGVKLMVSLGSHDSHLGQRFSLSPLVNAMVLSVILLPEPDDLTSHSGL